LANISKQKTSFTNIIGKVANLAKSAKSASLTPALSKRRGRKETKKAPEGGF
jgi:hypothetical protein